jgi:PAS domain S-box-containing protein
VKDEIIVLADRGGVIRFWSEGAERIFGYRIAEAVGKSLDLIVPPEYREAHWNGFRRAVESGAAAAEGQAGPFPAQCANGDILVVTGRLTLIRAPQGEVAGATVVFAALTGDEA